MTRARHDGRRRPSTRLLVALAAGSYAANAALGTAVAARLVVTGRWHWIHHALYIATSTLTALAIGVGALRRDRTSAVLAPTVAPLATIPFAGTRTIRHPVVALAAAPFYLAALLVSRAPATRLPSRIASSASARKKAL